ncbi:MAG: uL15 family ribosomal protein [Patescibacteria group bacterium]|jgi:large subunit ribosomal protein L15
MALSLNTIYRSRGVKKAKRVGRGNSSGHGTYSTRGLKGQKSRSGASGLKRLGLKRMLLATPKVRGFKSAKPSNQVVSVRDINKNFKAGETVSPRSLLRKGLVSETGKPIKILGQGALNKGLKFDKVKMSEKARERLK